MGKSISETEASRKNKRRRHGYRGFGSLFHQDRGGAVHWGRGFSGVGFPGEDGGVLPREAGLLAGDTRYGDPREA